jgi:hypothetical protein
VCDRDSQLEYGSHALGLCQEPPQGRVDQGRFLHISTDSLLILSRIHSLIEDSRRHTISNHPFLADRPLSYRQDTPSPSHQCVLNEPIPQGTSCYLTAPDYKRHRLVPTGAFWDSTRSSPWVRRIVPGRGNARRVFELPQVCMRFVYGR